MSLSSNIEVHFFKGDPGKGQQAWMYSIRDDQGYRRGKEGGSLFVAALCAVRDIAGEMGYLFMEEAFLKLSRK